MVTSRQSSVDLSAVPPQRAFSLHWFDGLADGNFWWEAELWAEGDPGGDGPSATGTGDTAEAAIAEALAAEQRGEVA